MCDLPGRVDPSVGPARDGQSNWCSHHGGQRFLDGLLDSAESGLGGPAGEVGAVVPDPQAQTTLPALVIDEDGQMRVLRNQSSCCDGGSE